MKKILALALAVVTMLLLASCDFPLFNTQSDDGKQPSEISRGTIKGDVYTSEYLGLSFTKPEEWVYSTDEEIAAALNLGADMILGENFKNALENNGTIYDMMVVDIVTRSNINVGFENLSKTFASNITVEQYIQAVKTQMESVAGMTVTFPESFETVKLGKTEFTKVECTATVQGVAMKQVYYLKKVDNIMCFITVTIPRGYTVEQIEAMFK
ncbi:MAG: hypothetical protein IKC31_00620 [Clostridia bacterium]|nr:hypothetical protein [Clostridia bacterium]